MLQHSDLLVRKGLIDITYLQCLFGLFFFSRGQVIDIPVRLSFTSGVNQNFLW